MHCQLYFTADYISAFCFFKAKLKFIIVLMFFFHGKTLKNLNAAEKGSVGPTAV